MLLTQKYVIISITYLTLSELPWGEGFSESQSLRLHVSRGWRLSQSEDSAANAVLNNASNPPTHLPYINIPYRYIVINGMLQSNLNKKMSLCLV